MERRGRGCCFTADLELMNTQRVELLRLGSRIRAPRTALGYNQRGYPSACALNHTCAGGVERGERNVTFTVLCTLCAALGCDVAAITQGIPKVTPRRMKVQGTLLENRDRPARD